MIQSRTGQARTKGNPNRIDKQTGHEQTAIGVSRAPRNSVTARNKAHKSKRRPNKSAKKSFDNHIRSRHNQQKSMNKNEVGLCDDAMVELHQINIGRDTRGVDMHFE